ncbi:unnamed protein product [Auanema sp. JU1783]|nr:unnamed protein product [Auanema sp. JU1783]
MDPSLLRQTLAFQKSAAKNVSVQQRPQGGPSASHTTYNAEAAKKKKKTTQPSAKGNPDFDFKTAVSYSNATNFQNMAKIVDYMKKRHLSSQQWALSLEEILDEIQVHDLLKKTEIWLKEALAKNPKLQVDENGKFTYQPPFKIKNRASLVSVVRKFHEDGKGGVLLSQINECIPNADKVLEAIGKEIIVVPTQVNKRKDKVVFWNDIGYDFPIDDEFKGVWRNVSVDHLDEKKIEEYLQKHGIDAMRDLAPKKISGPPKRKTPKRRNNGKVHNEHLDGILKDYDE